MRTTFGRVFYTTAGIVLLGLVLLGTFFGLLLRNYLHNETENALRTNAAAVTELASGYGSLTQLENTWDFRTSLSFSSRVSGTNTVICDTEGHVVLCSCRELYCEHIGLSVSQDFLQQVMERGSASGTEGVSAIYQEDRYVVGQRITAQATGLVMGVAVTSQPTQETQGLLEKVTDLFFLAALAVLLMCMVSISFSAQNLCRPLRNMASAAREFGHGNLKARVRTGSENTAEIDELAVAFNNMASSLEKAEYQRQEFVANVSHELKTPMTTIGGYIDGMLDGTIPPEKYRHYMQLVSDETRRLSRLVRSMLDISRLQDQGIPPERMVRFDVCECAGQVLISFERKIEEKKLQVQANFPDYSVYANADMDAITQVIYNLLDNAVKFCSPGGQLGLTIRESGQKVYVSVSNTGRTIPPEELPLVFDRFHKIDKSRSLNRDGWGLGLYIVRTIICSHGEDISVTSRDGKTEFTFTLQRVNSL